MSKKAMLYPCLICIPLILFTKSIVFMRLWVVSIFTLCFIVLSTNFSILYEGALVKFTRSLMGMSGLWICEFLVMLLILLRKDSSFLGGFSYFGSLNV